MNSKIIFAFVAGIVIGSVCTWKLVDAQIERKYNRIANEEIQSVVREFSKDVSVTLPPVVEPVRKQPDILDEKESITSATQTKMEYVSLTNDLHYNAEKGGANDMNDKPYVIDPDDYGENDEYDIVTLTYYADKVLEDDNGDIIDDTDGMVGLDSLSRFDICADDAIYVRNDTLKTDFEILRDNATYSEANSIGSYSVDE